VQKIDEFEIKIVKLLENSPLTILYKISKLTSEIIPQVIGNLVVMKSKKASKNYLKNYNLQDFEAKDAREQILNSKIYHYFRYRFDTN